MSHFPVLVVTKTGSQEELENALQPFHEYECTGVNDEYVIFVDETAELLENYNTDAVPFIFDAAGQRMFEPFSDRSMAYYNREKKTFDLPEGWEIKHVPTREVNSFEEYIRDEGYEINDEGRIGRWTNAFKWVWIDAEGNEVGRTIGDETLPGLRPGPTAGEFLPDEERRVLHVLQDLHEVQEPSEDGGSKAQVAHQHEVRPDGREMRVNVGGAELPVQDLRKVFGEGDRRNGGGSLPQDGQDQSLALHEVQYDARQGAGQSEASGESGSVSKVVRKYLISGSKWDWWIVGGRWSNMILAQDEDGSLVQGNSARWADVMIDTMRECAASQAVVEYDDFERVMRGREMPPTWSNVVDACNGDIEKARAEYNANETTMYLRKLYEDKLGPFTDPAEHFAGGKEDYVQRARDTAFLTHAIFKDGVWIECGEMGWWGVVRDEKDPKSWSQTFQEILATIQPDEHVTIVDCHI
jgi:hypothetical protein